MEQGETEGFFNAWQSLKLTDHERVESGEWLILTQWQDQPHRDLTDVPLISSFAKDDEQRELFRFGGMITNQIIRPYFLAPEVPQDRVLALREAFTKTMADPELLAEAERRKLDIGPLSGERVHQLVAEYFSMPAGIKSKLQQILR
jgi:hypothetical protein